MYFCRYQIIQYFNSMIRKYISLLMIMLLGFSIKSYAINALPKEQNQLYTPKKKHQGLKKAKRRKLLTQKIKEKFKFHLKAFLLAILVHFLLIFLAIISPELWILSELIALLLVPLLWGDKVNKRKSIFWSWFLGAITLIAIISLIAYLSVAGILLL